MKTAAPTLATNQTPSPTALGFCEVGSWSLYSELNSGVRFQLKALADERVIYAFTVDTRVKYIGVCDSSATTLKERMKRYQDRSGGGTNERVANLIQSKLSEESFVGILAWKPDNLLEVSGLRVDLVKGLENPLITAFQPEWNIRR